MFLGRNSRQKVRSDEKHHRPGESGETHVAPSGREPSDFSKIEPRLEGEYAIEMYLSGFYLLPLYQGFTPAGVQTEYAKHSGLICPNITLVHTT
jgi:hypothetical protein